MKPEYIQIYDRNTKGIKVLMWLGVVLVLLGFSALIWYVLKREFVIYADNFWQVGFLIFQGIITVFITWNALKSKRYFISWDEDSIRYLLPKDKQSEWIRVYDIQYVSIDKKEVVLSLVNNEQKRINLNFFYYPKRSRVLEYFQSLKGNLQE